MELIHFFLNLFFLMNYIFIYKYNHRKDQFINDLKARQNNRLDMETQIHILIE